MPKPLLRLNNLFKTFSPTTPYKVHSGWTLNPQIYIFKLTQCKCPLIAPAPKAQQCQLLSRTHPQHPAVPPPHSAHTQPRSRTGQNPGKCCSTCRCIFPCCLHRAAPHAELPEASLPHSGTPDIWDTITFLLAATLKDKNHYARLPEQVAVKSL